MKFWHWIVLAVFVFVLLNVYNAKLLGGVPVVGKYVSA